MEYTVQVQFFIDDDQFHSSEDLKRMFREIAGSCCEIEDLRIIEVGGEPADMYRITVEFTDYPEEGEIMYQCGEILSQIPLRADFTGTLNEYFIQRNVAVGEHTLHITVEKNGEYLDSDECIIKFDGQTTTVVIE